MKQRIEDITINLDDIKEELTESNTKLNYACKKLDKYLSLILLNNSNIDFVSINKSSIDSIL